MSTPSIHANAIVVEGAGILIRGPSKAGKSTLSVALIHAAQARGLNAALVGDDRIFLEEKDGRLIARGHPAIRGQLHVRGFGIIDMPSADSAPVVLVIDLVPEKPEASALFSRIELEGLRIERLKWLQRSQSPDILMLILEKIRQSLTEM